MLEPEDIQPLVSQMWQMHLNERAGFDRIYEYGRGLRGVPKIPEGASDEVKELAQLSVKNVLGLVRDAFAQNLSVVGYRNAEAEENDPAWATWQRNRMDARQAEVHRPALSYGTAYVTVMPSLDGPILRTRSPRRMLAVYDDPVLDAWPQYALETWFVEKDAQRCRRGLLYDEKYAYLLDLGWLAPQANSAETTATLPISVIEIMGDPIEHGAREYGQPVCPVVRFINCRDADDMILGEIEPLIRDQQAINSVNFDRLLVSRFGAFPQRVITGWQGTETEIKKASVSRVWTFDDENVKAQAFPAASVSPYNDVLEEMMQHVAMKAQISPAYVTGKMINLSAEALAAAEANEQRKLTAKRESFGESWEQVFRLAAEMDSDTKTSEDSGAEVLWRDTEARAYGAVIDGIVKLASTGIPIEDLLDDIPGMTQQRIQAIRQRMQAQRVNSLVDKLTGAGDGPTEVPPPAADAQTDQDAPGGS